MLSVLSVLIANSASFGLLYSPILALALAYLQHVIWVTWEDQEERVKWVYRVCLSRWEVKWKPSCLPTQEGPDMPRARLVSQHAEHVT
jgi:hypothetical protein